MPDSFKSSPYRNAEYINQTLMYPKPPAKPLPPLLLKSLDKPKRLTGVSRLLENAGRIELATDGEFTYVDSSVIELPTLEHLFYNSLKEVPGAWIAMEIALARFKKAHEEQ